MRVLLFRELSLGVLALAAMQFAIPANYSQAGELGRSAATKRWTVILSDRDSDVSPLRMVVRPSIPKGSEKIATQNVEFSRDGKTLAAASSKPMDSTSSEPSCLRLWSIPSGELKREVPAQSEIRSLAVSHEKLLVGFESGSIDIMDFESGRLEGLLPGRPEPVYAIKSSRDGSLLAVSHGERLVVWDLPKHKKRYEREIKARDIRDHLSDFLFRDNNLLFAVIAGKSGSGHVELLNASNGGKLGDIWVGRHRLCQAPSENLFIGGTCTGDRASVFSVDVNQELDIFRQNRSWLDVLQKRRPSLTPQCSDWNIVGYSVHDVELLDGEVAVFAFAKLSHWTKDAPEGLIVAFDFKALRERSIIELRDDWPLCMAIDPKRKLLAVGLDHGSVALFDAEMLRAK